MHNLWILWRMESAVAVHTKGQASGLLQEARAFQDSAAFAPYRALRHRWARLVQLGLRQARYRGRLKTKAQLLLAATVANLTRLWTATKETPPVLCPGT